MEPYALAAVLGVWLASLLGAFLAGRATIDDSLELERDRRARAEALAESRKADLVASALRATRLAADLKRVLDASQVARLDLVRVEAGSGVDDLRRALGLLLSAHGGDPGAGTEADPAAPGVVAADLRGDDGTERAGRAG